MNAFTKQRGPTDNLLQTTVLFNVSKRRTSPASHFTMTERIEQGTCIKFCQELGHSLSETIGIIRKAFDGKSMSETGIKEWLRRFKRNRSSVESNLRSAMPTTTKISEHVERVGVLINQNYSY